MGPPAIRALGRPVWTLVALSHLAPIDRASVVRREVVLCAEGAPVGCCRAVIDVMCLSPKGFFGRGREAVIALDGCNIPQSNPAASPRCSAIAAFSTPGGGGALGRGEGVSEANAARFQGVRKCWGSDDVYCSGPAADSGHPRMARAIHGWPGVRGWPANGGPSTDSADGLAFPTKMKTFWVIKYLNIYSTNSYVSITASPCLPLPTSPTLNFSFCIGISITQGIVPVKPHSAFSVPFFL